MSDVFAAVRHGWIWLAAYYAVAGLATVFVWRRFRLERFLFTPRCRIIMAAVLAVVFTPSVISDFFLFMVPGPAILGVLLMLPAAVVMPIPFIFVELVYYIIPLAIVFYLFRFLLWRCERHRTAPPQIV